jgi:hypothetical protein
LADVEFNFLGFVSMTVAVEDNYEILCDSFHSMKSRCKILLLVSEFHSIERRVETTCKYVEGKPQRKL